MPLIVPWLSITPPSNSIAKPPRSTVAPVFIFNVTPEGIVILSLTSVCVPII
jgi:hypothetical protein